MIILIGIVGSAAIAAGASLLGTAGNAVATGKLNKKTRKWNEKMWNMQNAYNLPEAQMQRFKDAGLNPNLIYGQGNSGNADAPKPWTPSVPDMSGVGGAVGKYFQVKLQQGQIERMKTENAILATDLQSKKLDLDVKQKLSHVITPHTEIDDTYPEDDPRRYVLSPKNMLYQGAAADIQGRIAKADASKVAAEIARKTQDSNISRTTSLALNEAAKTGLINASKAKSLTQNQLMELDKKLKQFEIDFQNNFTDINNRDLLKMLMQAIVVILK